MKPIKLLYQIHDGLPSSSLAISDEVAQQLFTPAEIESGHVRLEITTQGAWSTVSSVSGLVVKKISDRSKVSRYCPEYCATECIIYGRRKLAGYKQAGYDAEGYVTIEGKKTRAFTSSMIFQLPCGKLINCAILYLC